MGRSEWENETEKEHIKRNIKQSSGQEREKAREWENKTKKKKEILKSIPPNGQEREKARENETKKKKENFKRNIRSRREGKWESVCPCFSLKYLRRYYSVKHWIEYFLLNMKR